MAIVRSELLRKRLDAFTRTLPGVEEGDVGALHRARVASRRLRELLPLLQLDTDVVRKLGRRLRKVTRRLGTVRELDVLLLLIDELHVSRREYGAGLSRVAVAVAKERDDARSRLLERMPIGEMRKAARKLERSADHMESADADRGRTLALRAWRWAVDARVATRAERLRRAMDEAGAVYLPERLHAVRIAVKKLRYAVELTTEIAGQRSSPDLRALKRAQDVLGRMHDLQVLIDRVRQVQASLMPPSVTLWRALDALVTFLDNSCRQLHGRYISRRAELETLAARLGKARGVPAAPPRLAAG
jgi:CHAD domain-containing protein